MDKEQHIDWVWEELEMKATTINELISGFVDSRFSRKEFAGMIGKTPADVSKRTSERVDAPRWNSDEIDMICDKIPDFTDAMIVYLTSKRQVQRQGNGKGELLKKLNSLEKDLQDLRNSIGAE